MQADSETQPLTRKLQDLKLICRRIDESSLVTEAIRNRVSAIADAVGALEGECNFVEEMVPLNEILGVTQVRSPSAFSPAADSELIHAVKGAELVKHRKSLKVIDNFIRWGADPLSSYVFSERAYQISRVLSDDFKVLDVWIRDVQFHLNKNRNSSVSFLPGKEYPDVRTSIRKLERLKIFNRKPGVFFDKNSKRVGVKWEIVDKEIIELFGGHWLTAITRDLIKDQVDRNEVVVQFVTRLSLKLPKEAVGKQAVEYDLIVFVPGLKKLVWIECKSGSLARLYDSIDSLATAKQTLIDSSDIGGDQGISFEFICLIPDAVTKPDKKVLPKLRTSLEDHGIELVALSDLRAKTQSLFIRSSPHETAEPAPPES